MSCDPFLMKKLLKSEICGSRKQYTRPINSVIVRPMCGHWKWCGSCAQCTRPTGSCVHMLLVKKKNQKHKHKHKNNLNPNRTYIYFLKQIYHCSHFIYTPTDSSSLFFRLVLLRCFSTNRKHCSFYSSFFKYFFLL